MFSCCNYTYAKYLNEDGSINQTEYWKLVFSIREKGGTCDLPEHSLCKCRCHVIGSTVLH